MLAEAYDGDASEAQIAMNHALRLDDQKDFIDIPEEDADSRPSRRRAHTREPAEELAARDISMRTEAGKNVKAADHGASSIKADHDDLMLMSSQMQPIEAATYIVVPAFINLIEIFSQPLWQRRPDGPEALLCNQTVRG
ncbi:hypothetical protein DUT91_24215 [Phyllobacterium salinisoli]|uniref:Uncharacterized protein n=2 Tax=Phyllobacterium salinisoli TaxID=1899321 RepID=A0A368JZ06_9HYPH|nr:hypothetical protein DUT91_24215 [Phyllobacterium salinisoli]